MNGAYQGVKLYRIKLNANRVLRVGAKTLHAREILRIQILDERGERYVDCSPLPFLHSETFDNVLAAAKAYFQGTSQSLPISLQTAIESLAYPAAVALTGTWENSALLTPGVLPPPDARVCKIKVRSGELESLVSYLQMLLFANPSREFRIDCNEALDRSNIEFLKTLSENFPVAYFEEPLRDLSELKELAKVLPIALDENLGKDKELDELAKAWVIKPNVVGWNESLLRFKNRSRIQKVLSNVYESSATLQLYAHAYFSSVERPQALGFGTAFYFDEGLVEWNPKVFQGAKPLDAFAQTPFEGDLLWQL